MWAPGTYDLGEVLTAPLSLGPPCPHTNQPSRFKTCPPPGQGRVLWCIEPKARAVPPQFTCRHQEVEVPSG
ncbi:hypothetical protein GCM10009603_08720 [Nocardiopsis exhalans]